MVRAALFADASSLWEKAKDAPPLYGDQEIEGSNFGYGDVAYLTPDQLKIALAWMKAHPPESLAARFDPVAMTKADIYPKAIWERDKAEALEYVRSNYEALIKFYEKEVAAGNAMLFWLG